MKKTFLILSCVALGLISCNKTEATTETSTSTETVAGGQEAVVDEDSAPTIVKLAAGNKDLSTLVTAVEAAPPLRATTLIVLLLINYLLEQLMIY